MLEVDTIKHVEIKKEYLERTRNLLETKFHKRDKHLDYLPRKILETIPTVYWRALTNGQETNKNRDNA